MEEAPGAKPARKISLKKQSGKSGSNGAPTVGKKPAQKHEAAEAPAGVSGSLRGERRNLVTRPFAGDGETNSDASASEVDHGAVQSADQIKKMQSLLEKRRNRETTVPNAKDEPLPKMVPPPLDTAISEPEDKGKHDGLRASQSSEAVILETLLKLEREARNAANETELTYLIVNSSRLLLPYSQALLLRRKGQKQYRVSTVSSLSNVDRTSSFIRWAEGCVSAFTKKSGHNHPSVIDAGEYGKSKGFDVEGYPFRKWALLPLKLRDGTIFAQLVLTSDKVFSEKELVPMLRLSETYAHAWEALKGASQIKRRLSSKAWIGWLSIACIVLAGFLPVPLTALAPAEITARDPLVIAAPIDGVIEKIAIEPNTRVSKGDLLFSYSATELRNAVEVAGREVQVAEARFSQAERRSFTDPEAKRDLAIARSELRLKATEYDYAQELLAKAEVRAGKDGLVIYSSKDEWTGKPVATGERIMRIADPSKTEISLDLPVADAIVLKDGAKVKLFLDSSPLNAVEAKVRTSSFHAVPDAQGVLSYKIEADFVDNANAAEPNSQQSARRIGLRGTAQIYSDEVPLAFYLFRKPLSAVRQWIGY